MSDLTQLSAQIVTFLTPYLPYLIKGGKLAARKAFEKLGEQFSEEAWEQAKGLWEKLRHKKSVAQVAETVAKLPENASLRAALAEEIARALKEDPALLQTTTRIVGWLETGNVLPGGKVTGVRVKGRPGEGVNIESRVKTGDVSGEVTGVDYEA